MNFFANVYRKLKKINFDTIAGPKQVVKFLQKFSYRKTLGQKYKNYRKKVNILRIYNNSPFCSIVKLTTFGTTPKKSG